MCDRRTDGFNGEAGRGGDLKYGVPIDEENYAFGFYISGQYLILRCRQCSATVDAFFQKEHLLWHEKLRRAVDETGTLG